MEIRSRILCCCLVLFSAGVFADDAATPSGHRDDPESREAGNQQADPNGVNINRYVLPYGRGGFERGTLPGGAYRTRREAAAELPEEATDQATAEEESIFPGNELFGVPLLSRDPTVGFSLGGLLGYVFRLDPNDRTSPPSIAGGGGTYSENDSFDALAGAKLYLGQNNYRLEAAFVASRLNYRFYPDNDSPGVDLSQLETGLILGAMRRVAPNLFIGPRYEYLRIDTDVPDDPAAQDVLDELGQDRLSSQKSAPGVGLSYDTQDDHFYPRRGTSFSASVDFSVPALGSDHRYQVYYVAYNRYWSLHERGVLAVRGMGRFTDGDVPYYDRSFFGRGGDLRGYKEGRYQDRMMYAFQAEYRHEFTRRWGGVAFGGFGGVAPQIHEFTTADVLPSGGVGIRYRLTNKHRINIGLDVAFTKDDTTFVVNLGEAF